MNNTLTLQTAGFTSARIHNALSIHASITLMLLSEQYPDTENDTIEIEDWQELVTRIRNDNLIHAGEA